MGDGDEGGACLVVGLTPRLGLGVVTLETLEAVDSDVEVGDVQDCVEDLAGFQKSWRCVWLTIVSCDVADIRVPKDV